MKYIKETKFFFVVGEMLDLPFRLLLGLMKQPQGQNPCFRKDELTTIPIKMPEVYFLYDFSSVLILQGK